MKNTGGISFMPSELYQTERRKHKRYEVRNLAIAVPNKPSAQVARIVNISKGGMAVRYLDQNNWLGNANAVDILVNSNFLVTNIPIKNVSDFKVENQVSFSIISERQCCLQFGSLAPEQESLLDKFILDYGAGSS
jgi:c-di-GMP-binding flagellar brake protein YcgR